MKHIHHKIPKHMGGTDSPDNLEELTIRQHADAHKILFEKYGYWQDRLAWLGLLGIIPHEECIHISIINGAKKGGKISNEKQGKHRKHKSHKPRKLPTENEFYGKKYSIISPDGNIIEIVGLSGWCREKNINFKSFHKAVIQRKKIYQGYKLNIEL